MRRAFLVSGLLLLVSVCALAQCKDTLRAQSPSQIGLSLCPQEGRAMPKVGDTLVIAAGGGKITTTVADSQATLGMQIVDVDITDPANAQENVLLLVGVDTATVELDSTPFEVAVLQDSLTARNTLRYEWSVGPATQGEEDGESETAEPTADAPSDDSNDSSPGALRFRYAGEYARGGLFGRMKNKLVQTTAALSIDTTDQDSPDFIDNNQLSLGVRLTNLSAGRLWMHGKVGLEARAEKAFHQDVRNVDALVTVSGWVPVLRSFTLLSREGEFIAAPLSFKASYGYRDRDQSGESVKGAVFEGSALYHLFLLDQFQISFSATWTHNDLDQSENIPRTQRLYKATIAYLEDPTSGFKVLTSIEDGSAGVMLRKVRQYFIGVAISKLNLNGSGGS